MLGLATLHEVPFLDVLGRNYYHFSKLASCQVKSLLATPWKLISTTLPEVLCCVSLEIGVPDNSFEAARASTHWATVNQGKVDSRRPDAFPLVCLKIVFGTLWIAFHCLKCSWKQGRGIQIQVFSALLYVLFTRSLSPPLFRFTLVLLTLVYQPPVSRSLSRGPFLPSIAFQGAANWVKNTYSFITWKSSMCSFFPLANLRALSCNKRIQRAVSPTDLLMTDPHGGI